MLFETSFYKSRYEQNLVSFKNYEWYLYMTGIHNYYILVSMFLDQ